MLIGSQDDADFLTKATQDVDALFWVTPPGYGSDNVRAFQNRLGKAAATAIRTNHIPRVVNLSSIGAQFASGVGPINGLHDVEELLDDAADNITHLRPGFFFENLLWQADSIKNWDRISLADFRLAALPDDRHPRYRRRSGPTADGLRIGPGTPCGNCTGRPTCPSTRWRKSCPKVLGRKIAYVKCDRQEMRQILLDNAVSENAADLMLEMYDAIETGKLRPIQPRSAETTTPTTLAEFVHDVILPMMAAPVTH